MKSQINLLHKQFVPHFEWVCASHFFALIVFTMVLAAGGYGWSFYHLEQRQAAVDKLARQLQTKQQNVDELTTALTERATDPVLEAKFNNLRASTRGRTVLLNHVESLSGLKQRSFSSLFDSLAQSSSRHLWLTKFNVTVEELNFEGQLSQPKALPVWISQLSDTEFFKGQEFGDASLERKQDKLLFSLNSNANSSTDPTQQVSSNDVE